MGREIIGAEITVTFANGEKKTVKTTNFFFVSAQKNGDGANVSCWSAVNTDTVLSAVIHRHVTKFVKELEERDPILGNKVFQAIFENVLKDGGADE